MTLAVVAYPELDTKDREWVESIRAEHDALSGDIIAAHITLVFPVFDMDEATITNHVKTVARDAESIDFVMRCAVLTAPDVAHDNLTHVFLVPDEGFSRIVKLHDRLYSGPLASKLRLDLPFMPHMGVGNDLDPMACKRLADRLNAENFEIAGRITALDILRYETLEHIESLERVEL